VRCGVCQSLLFLTAHVQEQSPYERAVLAGVENEGLYENAHKYQSSKFTRNLSIFANREVTEYFNMEFFWLINQCHREAMLILRASLDAYRMDFFSIHQHMITQSDKVRACARTKHG